MAELFGIQCTLTYDIWTGYWDCHLYSSRRLAGPVIRSLRECTNIFCAQESCGECGIFDASFFTRNRIEHKRDIHLLWRVAVLNRVVSDAYVMQQVFEKKANVFYSERAGLADLIIS